MKIYRNKDQSFDVVNDNGVLFHLHNDCIRVIGRVSHKWQHHSRAIKRIPARYSRYLLVLTNATINEKMQDMSRIL
jgi:hypothetical protein